MSDHFRDRTKRSRQEHIPEVAPTEFQEVIAPPPQVSEILTVHQARQLPQNERLALLMRHNDMDVPVVIGIVTKTQSKDGRELYWLERLQTLKGRNLVLPLSESSFPPRMPFRLQENIQGGDRVVQRMALVSDRDPELREKGKPFAMNAIGRAELLKPIADSTVLKDVQGNILIKETVYAIQIAALAEPLEKEKNRLEVEAAKFKAQIEERSQHLTKEAEEKKQFFLDLNDAIARAEDEKQTTEQQVITATEELAALKKRKDYVMAAYQQMRDFASERGSLLLALDLISDEQFTALRDNAEDRPNPTDMLSWHDDLGANYNRLVSTIHSYLLRQGIIYPRWLVGNFLTLLRMNDLIILSGLSGAGKTQIVRSFAEVLGGVAHIMPVKPNWTGAEDLLGFFNPLQRSYVRTPFLEAILAASRDPGRLHLICLDEMNLARAEYYFADFLSALEDRSRPAEIHLYSESEASHIQAEVRMLLSAVRGIGPDGQNGTSLPQTLETMLQRPEIMNQLRSMFGESAAESFPAFHGRVRRALSTVLDIPAKVIVPTNVRFIGAINVDQTTYGLSPKVLDRAHVLRFENPLKYSTNDILAEAERHMSDVPFLAPIRMPPEAFMPQRSSYPAYDEAHPAAQWLHLLYNEYLAPLGLDIAFRTIRQAQLYWDLLADISEGDTAKHSALAKNLIVLQKVLPKFTMDGKVKVRFKDSAEKERYSIVEEMEGAMQGMGTETNINPNMYTELQRIRLAAKSTDKIFNYWA